jgi:protein phosphatase
LTGRAVVTAVRPAFKFETGFATHPGNVRARNEDGYLVRPESGVWAVADGMGGHEEGRLASETIVRALASIGNPASAPDLLARFEDRVRIANARLKEVGHTRGGSIIGATVAALLAHDRYYAVIWSGDSRIYLVRDGQIMQVSRDHTEAQELVDQGVLTRDEARRWPGRNVITRAIGAHDEVELEFEHGVLEPGDRFVICSDGLTDHVEDGEIRDRIMRLAPQNAVDNLIALTLARGATDNVTVIVVGCSPNEPAGGTIAYPRNGAVAVAR